MHWGHLEAAFVDVCELKEKFLERGRTAIAKDATMHLTVEASILDSCHCGRTSLNLPPLVYSVRGLVGKSFFNLLALRHGLALRLKKNNR